jgi:hypothetical protein
MMVESVLSLGLLESNQYSKFNSFGVVFVFQCVKTSVAIQLMEKTPFSCLGCIMHYIA